MDIPESVFTAARKAIDGAPPFLDILRVAVRAACEEWLKTQGYPSFGSARIKELESRVANVNTKMTNLLTAVNDACDGKTVSPQAPYGPEAQAIYKVQTLLSDKQTAEKKQES